MTQTQSENRMNLVTIRDFAKRWFFASGATFDVMISGSSYFSGKQALKKAEEVRVFVDGLLKAGIPEDHISLINASITKSSTVMSKSSSANYHMGVNCKNMELVMATMALIAEQKNVSMQAIAWEFPELEKNKRELVKDAVKITKKSAKAVAESLDVPLLGVHKLRYEITGLEPKYDSMISNPSVKKSRKATNELAGLGLEHAINVIVEVTADFIVGDFNS